EYHKDTTKEDTTKEYISICKILKKLYNSISFLSILCRANEIFLFLVLSSQTDTMAFIVFYFSFDFIFRLLPVKLPENTAFKILKFFIIISTFYVMIYQDVLHIYITFMIFLANGFTNQMVYNSIENTLMERTIENFIVFLLYSTFYPYFAKKYCLKDFIFFNELKL
ncbi:putative transporter, partial [Pseudoloma neurophilia]